MSQGEKLNIGEMMFHHTGDSHELDFEPLGKIHLPQWDPIQIGSLSLDLSPTKYVVFMILAAVIVYTVMRVAAVGVRRAEREGTPPKGFASAVEVLVLYVRQELAISSIGREMGPVYAPLIMTFFFFILTCNLLGLVPWGGSPTGNLAVTGALALISFAAIEIGGMRKLGFKGYMGTIFLHVDGLGKVGATVLMLFMAPIEILSKFIKPFALTVRLFGNITAGHFVILAMFGVVFMFGHLGMFSFGIGIVTAIVVFFVMLLELLVAFLQAYLFAVLTAVFIGTMQHEH
ncbi:MAG: F0F1 ATP synthase subunit A [Gemmatimonadales bacterium]|nr:F0F1 ATP synthase subunit A [Gemmatimonadales bacterium]